MRCSGYRALAEIGGAVEFFFYLISFYFVCIFGGRLEQQATSDPSAPLFSQETMEI